MTHLVEELGELDGEDDSLLQSLLGSLETRDIVPLDIGALGDNGLGQGTSHLGLLLVFFGTTASATFATSLGLLGLSCTAASGYIRNVQDGLLDVLGALQVLAHLFLVELNELRVFLDY